MCDQVAERCVFLLICLFIQNRIVEIFPCRRGRKYFKVQIQLTLEIVADIADDLLLCRCRKAGNGDRFLIRFLPLQFPDKISYVQIIHAKVLPPCGKAVGFIDNKAGHIPGYQEFLDGFGTQLLRRNVEESGRSVCDPLQSICPFDRIQQAVDGYRFGDPDAVQVVHLILH